LRSPEKEKMLREQEEEHEKNRGVVGAGLGGEKTEKNLRVEKGEKKKKG